MVVAGKQLILVCGQRRRDWILTIDVLFCNLFGNGFLSYVYDKDMGTAVDANTSSELLEYNHEQWEKNYQDITTNVEEEPIPQQQRDPTTCTSVQHHVAKKLAFPDGLGITCSLEWQHNR